MEFDNTFEVPLPPAEAWKVLLDIERIAPCMPGAELTEVVSKNIYKGKIGVRLGPVALTFAGIVKFEDIDDPRIPPEFPRKAPTPKAAAAPMRPPFSVSSRPAADQRSWCIPTSRCRARSRNTGAASASSRQRPRSS